MTHIEETRSLPTLADIEAVAEQRKPRAATLSTSSTHGFDSWAWKSYREIAGVGWDMAGVLKGEPSYIYKGPGAYLYNPSAIEPFSFTRASGEIITPGRLLTDGGTIPRIAWLIPEIDPWSYFTAYLLHDWCCARHHCDVESPPRSFSDTNAVLGEAIYTLMMSGIVAPDWRKAALIYTAVQGTYGRRYWDLTWDRAKCELYLPKG